MNIHHSHSPMSKAYICCFDCRNYFQTSNFQVIHFLFTFQLAHSNIQHTPIQTYHIQACIEGNTRETQQEANRFYAQHVPALCVCVCVKEICIACVFSSQCTCMFTMNIGDGRRLHACVRCVYSFIFYKASCASAVNSGLSLHGTVMTVG